MQMSEKIDLLATALSKAQGQITGAKKDSKNPFFSSQYADLASCWDACREALSAEGLSVIQTTARGEPVSIQWETTDQKTGEVSAFKVDTVELIVLTTLMHTSGQWISSPLPLIPRDATPQGIGSAITYGRRYGLCAMVGVAQVDDDGNASSGRPNGAQKVNRTNEVHSPKGDMGKNIHPDQAFASAAAMRDILMADYDEKIKMLKVLDKHDVLNRDPDLYVAASDNLSPKERNAWKTYVSLAKSAQKEDAAVSNAGRKF
jgi:ERF superfamily